MEKKRELTKKELDQIKKAQQKWKPTIFQSYQTPIYDMMASPLKWTSVKMVLFIIFAILAYHGFILLYKLKKGEVLYLQIGVVVMLMISFGSSYYRQWRLNNDLVMVMTLLKPNATKYDYESSPVIQNMLLRSSIGRGVSSSGAFAGGLLGGSIGGRRR